MLPTPAPSQVPTRSNNELDSSLVSREANERTLATNDVAMPPTAIALTARRGLAAMQEEAGEHEKAYEAWRRIGGICRRAGLLEAAYKDFHRAFQIRDDDPETVRELAWIEEQRGKDRNSAMLYARYAQLMINRSDRGAARDALQAAARLESNLPQVAMLMDRLAD